MLPNYYLCTACRERFDFALREAVYYVGGRSGRLDGEVHGSQLLEVPVRPAWCLDCATVTLVEDIAPVRAFENAYGLVRAGKDVEYPTFSEGMSRQESQDTMGTHLRWRIDRRHVPRVLCCGGGRYQHLDVQTPLLKHQECDFGFIEPRLIIGGYNGPGPGVLGPAGIGVYSGEGDLVGRLTWRDREANTWAVEPDQYPLRDVS